MQHVLDHSNDRLQRSWFLVCQFQCDHLKQESVNFPQKVTEPHLCSLILNHHFGLPLQVHQHILIERCLLIAHPHHYHCIHSYLLNRPPRATIIHIPFNLLNQVFLHESLNLILSLALSTRLNHFFNSCNNLQVTGMLRWCSIVFLNCIVLHGFNLCEYPVDVVRVKHAHRVVYSVDIIWELVAHYQHFPEVIPAIQDVVVFSPIIMMMVRIVFTLGCLWSAFCPRPVLDYRLG